MQDQGFLWVRLGLAGACSTDPDVPWDYSELPGAVSCSATCSCVEGTTSRSIRPGCLRYNGVKALAGQNHFGSGAKQDWPTCRFSPLVRNEVHVKAKYASSSQASGRDFPSWCAADKVFSDAAEKCLRLGGVGPDWRAGRCRRAVFFLGARPADPWEVSRARLDRSGTFALSYKWRRCRNRRLRVEASR